MQSVTLKLVGMSSMLLHSDRGANPLNPDAIAHKVLTSKRKKTDEDHLAIARSEYLMSFYEGDEVAIPSTNIKAAITNGAKFNKLGSAFNRSVMIFADMVPIQYTGPKSKEKMWLDPSCVDARSVKVGTARLIRYRPRLNDWSLIVDVAFDENMSEKAQIVTAAENAGRYIGLGDYRPQNGGPFGRFSVEVVK